MVFTIDCKAACHPVHAHHAVAAQLRRSTRHTPLQQARRLFVWQMLDILLVHQMLAPARLAAEMLVHHHEIELLAECVGCRRQR
jgi:hypothetical protein